MKVMGKPGVVGGQGGDREDLIGPEALLADPKEAQQRGEGQYQRERKPRIPVETERSPKGSSVRTHGGISVFVQASPRCQVTSRSEHCVGIPLFISRLDGTALGGMNLWGSSGARRHGIRQPQQHESQSDNCSLFRRIFRDFRAMRVGP